MVIFASVPESLWWHVRDEEVRVVGDQFRLGLPLHTEDVDAYLGSGLDRLTLLGNGSFLLPYLPRWSSCPLKRCNSSSCSDTKSATFRDCPRWQFCACNSACPATCQRRWFRATDRAPWSHLQINWKITVSDHVTLSFMNGLVTYQRAARCRLRAWEFCARNCACQTRSQCAVAARLESRARTRLWAGVQWSVIGGQWSVCATLKVTRVNRWPRLTVGFGLTSWSARIGC